MDRPETVRSAAVTLIDQEIPGEGGFGGQRIAAFVFRMAVMTFDPDEIDLVGLQVF